MASDRWPEDKVVHDIEAYGWHVIKVAEEEGLPGFAYTIGLYRNYKHPEIIVVGLDLDVAHRLVNSVGTGAKAGTIYEADKEYLGLIKGYGVTFKPVADRWYAEYLGFARRFYKASPFPALQCVWPDKERRYPWDAGFNERWREKQPLLM
jgi:hypothetical protein